MSETLDLVRSMQVGQVRTDRATVVPLRDRNVMRFVGYWDRVRALADLGLEA
jgi:hypothetical protein